MRVNVRLMAQECDRLFVCLFVCGGLFFIDTFLVLSHDNGIFLILRTSIEVLGLGLGRVGV